MNSIKDIFEHLREDIAGVKSLKQVDQNILTALWTSSIYTTMEKMRDAMPELNEWEVIAAARNVAMRHFDITLLAAHGVISDDDLDDEVNLN